jgi:hypothetical protein
VTIRSDGDVGIDTEAPEARLHVMGGDDIGLGAGDAYVIIGSTADENLAFDDDSIQARSGGNAFTLHLQPLGGRIEVHADQPTSERVVITNDGRVGIGEGSPDASLHIAGASTQIRLDANTGTDSVIQFRENAVLQASIRFDSSSGQLQLRDGSSARLVMQGAQIGIGVTDPDNTLHVAATLNQPASPDAHVALIENLSSGNDADVLALRIGSSSANQDNNFITFYEGTNDLGSIEYNGFSLDFGSPGNDYAEALPKRDPGEELEAGDVVGVFGGAVTRKTEGAEQLLAVTDRPIIVANRPPREERERYATVAMVGQLPIRVRGKVEVGDFLIASGEEDGTAVAVKPNRLALGDLPRVVGRAWEASKTTGVKRVRSVICVQSALVSAMLQQLCGEEPPASKKTSAKRKPPARRRKA